MGDRPITRQGNIENREPIPIPGAG